MWNSVSKTGSAGATIDDETGENEGEEGDDGSRGPFPAEGPVLWVRWVIEAIPGDLFGSMRLTGHAPVAGYWLTKLGSSVVASRPVSRDNPPIPLSLRAFSSSVTAVSASRF